VAKDNVDDEDDELEDEEFDFEDLPELPPDAGKDTDAGFEPNDEWLKTANRKLQHAAMWRWFFSRYQDPAMETPYTDGEYVYIHGGPYEAGDELYGRFGDVIDNADEVIGAVIEDVESEGITDWAPIHHEREDDFDDRFALSIESESEPLRSLRQRLQQQLAILALEGPEATKALARQLVFAAIIGALEAFLYEVAYFWIDTNEATLRAFVTGLGKFRQEKIALADIFKQMEDLKARAKGHLQATVWHRWDHVAPIYRAALGVRLPSVEQFETVLEKRHDIVHRSGHDKDGVALQITDGEITALATTVEEFAVELEKRIEERNSDATTNDLAINADDADAPIP
jgi:hypothetical protein